MVRRRSHEQAFRAPRPQSLHQPPDPDHAELSGTTTATEPRTPLQLGEHRTDPSRLIATLGPRLRSRGRRRSRGLHGPDGRQPAIATLHAMGEPSAAPAPNPSWVSVPVPEHLLDEVQVFLLHLSLSSTPYAWDLEAMAEHLGRLGERGRRLVTIVAESMLQGTPLTAPALAERLDVHVHEVFGIMHLANDVVGVPRPDLLWNSLNPEGAPAVERVVMMSEPLVTMVITIDRGASPEQADASV